MSLHDEALLLQLVRVARGLEAGGYYNAAKLFRAALFARQIHATNDRLLRPDSDALHDEMNRAIEALERDGAAPHLIAAMRAGQQGVLETRTIIWDEVPAVAVCRVCGEILLGEMPGQCPSCGADRLTFHDVVPVYFFDPLMPSQVVQALTVAPERLAIFCTGLSAEQLEQRPEPGEWSIRETLWHILVAEELFGGRVKKMLAEDNPSLSSLASWTVTSQEPSNAHEILDKYRARRRDVLTRLTAMNLQDWWRTGVHEEWGQVTVLQQATYFARHERSHWSQIAAARRVVEAT